jgi:hypothetical protein
VTSTARVAEFLRVFKERAEKVGGVYVMDRVKNRDALLDLGLTKRQREEIILSLTPEDYCGGPLRDKKGSGHVWIFGRVEEGREIYIKLKVTHMPICLSFHPAEHPLQHPLRGRKEGR